MWAVQNNLIAIRNIKEKTLYIFNSPFWSFLQRQ